MPSLMMTPDDLALARSWIGRAQESDDIVAPHLVARFHAPLDPYLAPTTNHEAPLAIHWCLATDAAQTDDLDDDGHAKRGAFLPPCPLPKRMAAGGALTLHAPIPIGARITRRAAVTDVALREGRTGQLFFVTTEQTLSAAGTLALTETQTLVFREAGSAPAAPSAPASAGALTARVEATPARLFRYSALTFNAHRIHYDRVYAREAEGYAGLVVHGPLQATLLLNHAAILLGRPPSRFSFRAEAALYDGAFELCGKRSETGAAVWTRAGSGGRTMSGDATT